MDIVPREGGRYLVAIGWWPDDVKATYKGGRFIPDGFEDKPDYWYTTEHLLILEEIA